MSVVDNLREIEQKINEACNRVNRNRDDITIIAVTKYVSIEKAKEAIVSGVRDLGENRDEGLLYKWNELNDEQPVWHYIGSLQSKKVKNVIDKIDFLHSLDRISIAKEIQKRASAPVKCFIQVNISGELSKQGVTPKDLHPFLQELEQFPLVKVVGLMTMAPFTDNQEEIRNCFRGLKGLQKDVQALGLPYAPCLGLSMGMSNDYEIAIEEGATFIRLGTSLVGKE